MTPIERDDILRLSIKMDDILDGIEHFAAHLEDVANTIEAIIMRNA